MLRHLYVVGYDIADKARRRRAFAAIRGYVAGGQKSLHECWMTTGEATAALQAVRSIIDHEQDRAILIRLGPSAWVLTRGRAVPPAEYDWVCVS